MKAQYFLFAALVATRLSVTASAGDIVEEGFDLTTVPLVIFRHAGLQGPAVVERLKVRTDSFLKGLVFYPLLKVEGSSLVIETETGKKIKIRYWNNMKAEGAYIDIYFERRSVDVSDCVDSSKIVAEKRDGEMGYCWYTTHSLAYECGLFDDAPTVENVEKFKSAQVLQAGDETRVLESRHECFWPQFGGEFPF